MSFGQQLLDGLKEGLKSTAKSLPGAAIGMGTSFLGGLINQGFERRSLDYQAQLNEQSAINAYNRQLDFWHRQNAYNSPAAQVNRLRAAGLNPALINANGVNNTAGTLSSTPQSSPGSPGGNRINPAADASALADYAYKVKQMGFLDTQTAEAMERILSIQVERGIKALEGQLRLTEAEKASLDYEEFYEALYDKAVDGGPPKIKNNSYKVRVDEARARIKLTEAEESYAKAQESYTKAMQEYQENKDSREAALNLVEVAAVRAAAAASYKLIEKYGNDIQMAKNEDARAETLLELEEQMQEYLRQINASDAEIAKANEWLAKLWTEDAEDLMRDFGVTRGDVFKSRWLDFFHSNLRLGGTAGFSSSKK